jgi:hypothetical protein
MAKAKNIDEKFMTEEVKKSQRLYLDYSGGKRSTWEQNAVDDRKAKINAWREEHVKVLDSRGQMAVPVNEVLPAIDLIIAELTENNPRFTASGTEKSDYKVSGYVADLFSWIWDKSKGETKIDRFTRDFIEIGLSAFLVYFDPFADNGKGEIKFIDIDPVLELFIDPSSREQDASDSDNLLISKVITEDVVRNNYPNVDLKRARQEGERRVSSDGSANTGQVLQSQSAARVKTYRLIDRYTKIRIPRYHVYDPISNYENIFENQEEFTEWGKTEAIIMTKLNQEHYITDQTQIDELKGVLTQYGNVYHVIVDPTDPQQKPQLVSGVEYEPYAVPGSTTELRLVTKADLIVNGVIKLDNPPLERIQRVLSIGGMEVANEILPIRDYPIITCMLHHDRTPYPMGDIRITRPLQEQLDKLSNLIMTYLQNITNLSLIIQKDSAVKKELEDALNKAGVKVIEVDFENDKPPFPLQYPAFPNAAFQEKQNIIRQIQRIIGSYSFQDGEVQTAPRTLGGTQQIDQMMQRRASYKQRKIEATLNQMAKVIAQLIPKVYTERKEIRILKPNHLKPQEIIFNQEPEDSQTQLINDLTSMEYDVKVVSGSTLPSNRQQELQTLNIAFQNQIIHDPTPIVELLPINNIDEVLEREDALKNAQSATQQLQEQIKQMGGQIQTLQRELIQKEQKVEEMRTKTQMQNLVNELKSAVSLTKQRLSDHIKNNNKKLEA